MDTIFINSQNSETSDLLRILLNLSERINLKRSDKYVALSNLIIHYIHGKIQKSHAVTINLKYLSQRGMNNFNYLIDPILYQIFKIILTISVKIHGKVTDNPPIRIYVNKIE